ncbi:site-specific DNA-methyltransferase [Sphingomonas prati]|uniref:site-specific DNA-methyltransferase (adenine-specific) n=1 Tax=Sphingomonas prati TaxID=1843237 RepID=A0A7W9F2J9_9SPHN|nr:DNA methyltransferase [Sphingomonas prati]MBB5730592.1 DNA modification methylase [Sphingomonas prati]GGE95196.1 methyltransferase [Sphingomonas prati]
MPNLFKAKILELAVAQLVGRPGNARTHSKKQVRQIADSIRKFGFTNPVLIDRDRMIVAGHGRLEAAKLLGLDTVPTLCLAHLTPAEVRAYGVADNRLGELSGWDKDLLALEILSIEELDVDFDLTLTGFELEEIDSLRDMDGTHSPGLEAPSPAPAYDHPAVSRAGDVWLLGDHRLLCGDARDEASYATLLQGRKVDLVITDPPYNVKINGHVSGKGAVQHREFAMASGEMSKFAFQRFLLDAMGCMAKASRSGALHYLFIDWRHLADLLAAGEASYHKLVNIAVWAKSNGGMGTFYRSRHEMVAIFQHGRRAHINNIALGKHGRNRTNVWDYPGVNSFGASRDKELAMHPTVKPQLMIADAIRDASHAGDLVLDPFAGSGTTLLACVETGRCARIMELDPHYCDLIVRRGAELELTVTLETTGRSFDVVKASRTIVDPLEVAA